jgi:hypothetical protein
MAIRHMWRVANGLDNVALYHRFSLIVMEKIQKSSQVHYFHFVAIPPLANDYVKKKHFHRYLKEIKLPHQTFKK